MQTQGCGTSFKDRKPKDPPRSLRYHHGVVPFRHAPGARQKLPLVEAPWARFTLCQQRVHSRNTGRMLRRGIPSSISRRLRKPIGEARSLPLTAATSAKPIHRRRALPEAETRLH